MYFRELADHLSDKCAFLDIESMATIGFGTEDIFFDDCILPVVVLALQVCTKLVADAFTIGILYSRISRPYTRANSIQFADKAIIRRIRGRLYFMFQLCEMRKTQLGEAHVRLYVIRHNREPELSGLVSHFQTCSMRLNHPNDELGGYSFLHLLYSFSFDYGALIGMLLLCLPQMVVHEIDLWSPLYPPPVWRSKNDQIRRWKSPLLAHPLNYPHNFTNTTHTNGDSMESHQGYNSLHQNIYPLSGGGYAGRDDWIGSEVFPGGSRRFAGVLSPYATAGNQENANGEGAGYQEEKEMIQAYMQDRRVEIVVVVEGLDPATGGAVQARHSYTLDEVLWDRKYAGCVHEDESGAAVIDFSRFHDTLAADGNAEFSGIIPSQV